MLRAYFDDSGTHDESKAVVVGGLIGTVAQWKGFETAWAAKLADPLPEARKPPLQVFHLSECVGRWPGSEFAHYTDAERDAVIHDFRQIIISSGLIGMGAAIDLVAWNELVYGRDEEVIENPLEICAARCIEQAIAIADPHPEGDAIAVFFDQGIETDNLHG